MSKTLKSALLLIAAGAISTSASAHIGTELHHHSSFMTGLLHPLGGLDHLLAMLAVGGAVGALMAAVIRRHDGTTGLRRIV